MSFLESLSHTESYEQFQGMYQCWGHFVTEKQVQGVLLTAALDGRRDIAALSSEQRAILVDTLDEAIPDVDDPPTMQLLFEKGGLQVARDAAIVSAAERSKLELLKTIYEAGATPTAIHHAFVVASISADPIIKFLKRSQTRASEIAIKRSLDTVFEYLYVEYNVAEYADDLLPMAVDADALAVVSDTSREAAP